MEIILLERVEKLGKIGDIVTVKAGFARNFLLPQKKALRATDANKKYFEAQRKHLEERNKSQIASAEKLAVKAKDVKIVLLRQASESGQLYGSVTARDIAKAIRDQGMKEVRRGNVVLDAPIKELGIANVHIRLHADVIFDVQVNIARSAEEAEAQVIEAKKLFESEELAKVAEETLSDKPAEEETAEGVEAAGEEKPEAAEKVEAKKETKEEKPKKKAKADKKSEKKAKKAPAKKAAKADDKKADDKAEKKPAKKAPAKKK